MSFRKPTPPPIKKDARIFVAGPNGLVGSAILRKLEKEGYTNLLRFGHAQLDLTCQLATNSWFDMYRPEYVFLAAAKVGGIMANATQPARFIYDNLMIQTNVIEAAYRTGAKKLLFLGSSCIYPKFAPQPMKEEHLLTGTLESTNEAYAIAKIAGIKMCESYRKQYGFNTISLQPTNLYGPGDNYDLNNSHVLPAMIRKFHEAKTSGAQEVILWGTGMVRREFLHVDDLADAAVFLMERYNEPELINVGTGEDITITELAEIVDRVVGFQGDILFDSTKPDGTPRKLLDVSRLTELGWKPKIELEEGITQTYASYVTRGR